MMIKDPADVIKTLDSVKTILEVVVNYCPEKKPRLAYGSISQWVDILRAYNPNSHDIKEIDSEEYKDIIEELGADEYAFFWYFDKYPYPQYKKIDVFKEIMFCNEYSKDTITFYNYEFHEGIRIKNEPTIKGTVNFNKCNIKKAIRVENYINSIVLSFNNSSIEYVDYNHEKINLKNKIQIDKCTVKEMFMCQVIDEIKINQSTIENILFYQGQNLTIENSTIGNIKESKITNLTIKNSSIENPTILKSLNKTKSKIELENINTGTIFFDNVLMERLDFKGYNEANITFQGCVCQEIFFDNFNNKKNIFFNQLRVEKLNSSLEEDKSILSILFIKNSDLGKTRFASVNFKDFSQIIIEDSVLIDIISVNNEWFEDEKLNNQKDIERRYIANMMVKAIFYALNKFLKRHDNKEKLNNEITINKKSKFYPFINKIRNRIRKKRVKTFDDEMPLNAKRVYYHSNKRNVYYQLKKVHEKQGDTVLSLHFKALEMAAYQKELELHDGRLIDKTVLWIGWTNNFGQSWLRPILLHLGINFLFCLIFIYATLPLTHQWRYFGQNIIYFCKILRPFHDIENIFPKGVPISGWVFLLDTMLQILSSIFIFQAVSASRKFIKTI